jgi:hypothetical protein
MASSQCDTPLVVIFLKIMLGMQKAWMNSVDTKKQRDIWIMCSLWDCIRVLCILELGVCFVLVVFL